MAEQKEYDDKNKFPKQDAEPSEYPREIVFKTSGGITFTCGNKEGKEYLTISHPSGSSTTYHPDGTVTNVNQGGITSYSKGGGSVTFDENLQMTITGHVKFSAGGGAVMEVKGDLGLVVAGSVKLGVMENLAISGKNVFIGATGKFNIESKGDLTVSSRGEAKVESQGTMKIGSAAGIENQAPRIDHNKGGGGSGYQGPGAAPTPSSVPALTS